MDDKDMLHTRKSNRLQKYDYSSAGCYFITVCVKDKKFRLSHVVGAPIGRPTVKLTGYGKIVNEAVNNIEKKYLML